MSKWNSKDDFAKAMVGALVSYDALPYEMATPDYDRLERHAGALWKLDEQAAKDFVEYWSDAYDDA